MDVVIRRAGAADAAALARIGATLFEQTYAGSIPPEDMAAHVAEDFGEDRQRAELRDPSIRSFLVEEDGAVLGFAQLRARPVPTEKSPPAEVELWRIYLDRALHGRGVAARLLSLLGEAAREVGASGVWLSVWSSNTRAVAFYEKHGFVRVGRQDFHVGGEVHCDLVLRAPADVL